MIENATVEELLASLVNDVDFKLLHQSLCKFNIFEATGAVRNELRHSNFLGFLLSPSRGHGLGAAMLRAFLQAAIGRQQTNERPVSILELITSDLDGAIVHREWGNIDLLIEIQSIKLVVVIENKIDSSEGGNQLNRYKSLVQARYPSITHRHLFIFLTPDGDNPSDGHYLALDYSGVATIIENTIRDHVHSASDEIAVILRHYVEMLRRHIVEDKELAHLAARLYEKYREAFEFVEKHRPKPENILAHVRERLAQTPSLDPDTPSPNIVRFAPISWKNIEIFNASPKETWTHTKRNLIFEVKASTSSDKITLYLILGPSASTIRNALYDACIADPKTFVGLTKPMGKSHTTIFLKEFLSIEAAKGKDMDEKRIMIDQKWSEFISYDLPRLEAELAKIAAKICSATSET